MEERLRANVGEWGGVIPNEFNEEEEEEENTKEEGKRTQRRITSEDNNDKWVTRCESKERRAEKLTFERAKEQCKDTNKDGKHSSCVCLSFSFRRWKGLCGRRKGFEKYLGEGEGKNSKETAKCLGRVKDRGELIAGHLSSLKLFSSSSSFTSALGQKDKETSRKATIMVKANKPQTRAKPIGQPTDLLDETTMLLCSQSVRWLSLVLLGVAIACA